VSRRPAFSDKALLAVLGRRPPAALTRKGRVALLGRCAEALLRGELPDPESRLFLAGGLLAWLTEGGSLTRHFWKTAARRGSHFTEAALWLAHRDESGDGSDPL
jgi:hypothetical protein